MQIQRLRNKGEHRFRFITLGKAIAIAELALPMVLNFESESAKFAVIAISN
jgi:hypothetical protein